MVRHLTPGSRASRDGADYRRGVYRFLLTPRWIGFALFVAVLSGVSIQLGIWQFHKLHDRQDRNAQIREFLAADPMPLDEVVARGSDVTPGQEWRRVTAVGRFDVRHVITVKFVSRDGRPGVDVVTPLVLADGSAVLVNRGFLETIRTNQRPTDIPAPPQGIVEVTGWLRPDNGAGPDATRVSGGQVRAIAADGIARSVPYDLRDGFMNQQQPEPTGLEVEPRPDLGQGPHFFYGLQWWFFAALAIVGYLWFARIEVHPPKKRRTTSTEDEAEEPTAGGSTANAQASATSSA